MKRFNRVLSSILLCCIGMFIFAFITKTNLLGQVIQGPAPVPKAVAIPRPAPEEVKAAEKSLDKLLKTADPELKGLIEKYPGLITVSNPRPNPAIIPNLMQMFQSKHQKNLKEIAEKGDFDLLFMGDSITDFWRNPAGLYAGKPVQDKYFGDYKVANFGIAGDRTQGVLYRLQNGEGKGFSPKAIMLMIGTNNTADNNSPEEIAEGIGAVVLELQKDFPKAKILLLGVFPRGGAKDPIRNTVAEINKLISKLDDGKSVYYLDISKDFLDSDGNIPKDVMSDGLHPTTKGYEIWAKAVKKPLKKLMK